MQIMLFLILVSLTVAAGFLIAFLFASRNGQFDDDCTPAIRMLFDNTIAEKDKQDDDTNPSL
jgi:cbb3-type cytochrome oxidase maturation protein